MLILPPGHRTDHTHQMRALAPREKWMLGGVLGVVAALAVVLVISLATAGHKSGHGCISVGLAYSVGGAQVYRCGDSARAMCASVNRPGGSVGATARALATECRKAGLPVG